MSDLSIGAAWEGPNRSGCMAAIERSSATDCCPSHRRANMQESKLARHETLGGQPLFLCPVRPAALQYHSCPGNRPHPSARTTRPTIGSKRKRNWLLPTHHFCHLTLPAECAPWPQPSADDLQSLFRAPPQSEVTGFIRNKVRGEYGHGGVIPHLDPPTPLSLPTCILVTAVVTLQADAALTQDLSCPSKLSHQSSGQFPDQLEKVLRVRGGVLRAYGAKMGRAFEPVG